MNVHFRGQLSVKKIVLDVIIMLTLKSVEVHLGGWVFLVDGGLVVGVVFKFFVVVGGVVVVEVEVVVGVGVVEVGVIVVVVGIVEVVGVGVVEVEVEEGVIVEVVAVVVVVAEVEVRPDPSSRM